MSLRWDRGTLVLPVNKFSQLTYIEHYFVFVFCPLPTSLLPAPPPLPTIQLVDMVQWLSSKFWTNGDRVVKSVKKFLATLLVFSFKFEVGATGGCAWD